MIKLFTLISMVSGIATSAISGSLDTVVVEPQMAAVTNTAPANWAGLYFGASAVKNDGEQLLIDSGVLSNTFPLTTDVGFGAFAGYNFQFGKVVAGPELAYTAGGLSLTTFSAGVYGAILDGKFRVGLGFNKILAYGFAGYSTVTYMDNVTPSTLTGLNYGAGLTYRISDRMFVGAEYMVRNLDGYQSNDPGVLYETNMNVIQIRAGLQF